MPDAILFKPAALDEAEFALIAQHPVIGSDILRDVDFLGDGKLVVRHHHERWDGRGYPDRLAGEDIPLAARVFAVADALDALTTDRPYRRGTRFSRAREEIRAHAGSQFDPAVVDALDSIPDARFAALRDGSRDADDPDRRRRSRDPQADRHHARGRGRLPARRRRPTAPRRWPWRSRRGRRSCSSTSTCRS